MLFFFYPFRDEKELSPGFPAFYENKLKQGVQDTVKISRMKFVPYGYLVDQAYFKFNETLLYNQDPHNQLEKMKHHEQNIPMKTIQKTQKQPKYYRMMKIQKI